MIKEIKYGGYTTTPSDYECPDGELATVVNLCPDDEGGALRPVLPPTGLFALPDNMEVLLIHHTAAYLHYIIIEHEHEEEGVMIGDRLWWLDDEEDIQPRLTGDGPISASVIAGLLRGSGVSGGVVAPIVVFGEGDHIKQVVPVGNTLVVLTDSGVHYILWDTDTNGSVEDVGGTYEYMGQKPPEIHISWGLRTELSCYPKDKQISGGGTEHTKSSSLKFNILSTDIEDAPFISDVHADAWVLPKDVWTPPEDFNGAWDYSLENVANSGQYTQRWTDYALGHIQKFVTVEGMDKGRFVYPFFVRWAYEMYDGSLIYHSDPVLLIPNSKYPFFGMDGHQGILLEDVQNGNCWYEFWGRAYGFVSQLTAKIIDQDAADKLDELKAKWKDVIKGISVYVSAPIYTYKQDSKVWGWTNMDDEGAWDEYYTEGEMTVGSTTKAKQWMLTDVFDAWNVASEDPQHPGEYKYRYFENYHEGSGEAYHPMPSYIFTMPEKSKEDIARELETGQFYKIKDYDMDASELVAMTNGDTIIDIEEGALGSLVARELMKDDYHTKDQIKATSAFAYNGRINLGGIFRTLHQPLTPQAAWPRNDDNLGGEWTATVEIRKPGATNIIASEASEVGCALPRYVFYPDTGAKTMYVSHGTHKWRLILKEHPFLEGAYWCGGLSAELSVSEIGGAIPSAVSEVVNEEEKVMTSEINNPFYFPLLGINSVGTGEVLAVCAANKALSQGQFGEHPLYAFTTEGVWALATTSSGGYSAVQPFTRDVCRNTASITQLDDSVLFASDRGVMCISGSQVVCLSDNLESDKQFAVSDLPGGDSLISLAGIDARALTIMPWREFLAGCKMIYDYTGQRVVVYHPSVRYAYIYSLKTHKWGMMHSLLTSGVNSYPQALAMDNTGALVDVSNGDEGLTGIKGMVITRPFKLDPIDALKTIDTIIQRGYFDYADQTRAVKPVRQILWGSRDLFNWRTIWSSTDHYLRGEWGTPYKYFRLGLLCDLKKEESLTGCTVQYQVRGTNQPR